MSILQRICQCGLVDQSTSSAIDDAHSTLCFLQTCSIKKMSRFWRERCVQTDEIGSGEEIIQFVHELNLQRTGTRRRQIGIIRDHPHAESDGAACQFTTDAAHPDHAEYLVVKFDTFEIFPLPVFAAHTCIGCGIFRATQSKSENACSAVETVFPPGALRTTTPRWVAASTSTLSTPTPARPTTRRRVPAFKTSAVTFVWLRTTSALNSRMISSNSVSLKPVLIATSSASSRESSSIPRWEIESAIRTFGVCTVVRKLTRR